MEGASGTVMRRDFGEEGFTLMEMLVVVAIIGILGVAFGASFLGWREKYKAESDIKKIHAAFMDAKINALKERRHVFVFIPPAASKDDQLIKLYKDINTADPLKPGNGLLELGTDEQLGPDRTLEMRIVFKPDNSAASKYRKTWFNARGHLNHGDFSDTEKRDFSIFLLQKEENKAADADINCFRVMPPLYVSGGSYNGNIDDEFNYESAQCILR